jgi:hypothetical protein
METAPSGGQSGQTEREREAHLRPPSLCAGCACCAASRGCGSAFGNVGGAMGRGGSYPLHQKGTRARTVVDGRWWTSMTVGPQLRKWARLARHERAQSPAQQLERDATRGDFRGGKRRRMVRPCCGQAEENLTWMRFKPTRTDNHGKLNTT